MKRALVSLAGSIGIVFASSAFADGCDVAAVERGALKLLVEGGGLQQMIDNSAPAAIAAQIPGEPEQAPMTTQATAPASAAASTTTVDSPERPRWLALAIEQGFADNNDSGGVTISLSPYDWLEKASPEGTFDEQGKYVAARDLRRFTGSLSLGDRGEALDGDADGALDEPALSKSLSDSMLLELQYRFYGSRDRREVAVHKNYRPDTLKIEQSAGDLGERYGAVFADERIANIVESQFPDDALLDAGQCERAQAEVAAAISSDPQLHSIALGIPTVAASIDQLVEDLAGKIDTSWVWSVGVSALEREDYLGRDQLAASLRGLQGLEKPGIYAVGSTLLFNLDYSVTEGFSDADRDLRAAKLAVGYTSAFSGNLIKKFERARWSMSLAGEKTWNAPESAKKSEAVLGFRLEVPVSEEITIPFSIKWSNRNELLQDESEIVAHVGLSIDLESFFAQP